MEKSKILKELFRSKNTVTILTNIKDLEYKIARKKINQALGHPIAKKIISNRSLSLPRSYSQLRKGRQLPYTKNIEGELAFYIHDILYYSQEINDFLKLEKSFSELIFRSNWTAAEMILDEIEEKVCLSYWGIENRFAIRQLKSGTESNWEYLKLINKSSSLPYSLTFQQLFSRKAESENTVFQYKKDIENVIKHSGIAESEYVLFKTGYLFSDEFSDYGNLLHLENLSSIVDKYLFLIEILIDISIIEKKNELVLNTLNDLEKSGIKDSRISRLKENIDPKELQFFDKSSMDLIDIYTKGQYEDFISICQNETGGPKIHSVEILNLYVKSLIEQGSAFKKLDIGTLWNELLEDLYNVYSRNEKFYNSRENILKYSLLFPNDKRTKQLLSLFSHNTNLKGLNHPLEKFYYYYSETTILSHNLKVNTSNPLIKESLSYQLTDSIINNSFSNLPRLIPDVKLLIYQSRSLLLKGENLEVSKLENELYSRDNSVVLREEILKILFYNYIENRKYYRALKIYVDIYFENEFLIEGIKDSKLLNEIVNDNYNLSKISVEFPIYFFLESADYYFQYVALDFYLNSITIDRPSELKFLKEPSDKYQIFLLEEVCNIDVLNNFYLIFSTDNEIIEERIKILKNLSRISENYQNRHLEEIATLTQRKKIKEYIESSNNGKINLNFTRIKEDKVYNLENSFNRFIKLNDYTKNNELKLMDASETISSYLSDIKVDNSRLQDASYLSFKTLFLEVVDQFLYSKEHGLDGDLSTRIRHGVLENQLRSVFMDKQIIANKNSDGNYNDVENINQFFEDRNYKENVVYKTQEIIKNFSKAIDDEINILIKELIQIQSNNNRNKSKGLFNYYFTEEYLYIVFRAISDENHSYGEFLNICFDSLKLHTDGLLKNVSSYFKIEVNKKFYEIIEKLRVDLKQFFPENDEFLIKTNQELMQCSTIVQREINAIADWFKLSNTIDETVLDFNTIASIAVESINLYSKKVDPKIDVRTKILFQQGLYYVDLLKIMLENAIKHSGLSTNQLELEIAVDSKEFNKENENFSKIEISISNNLDKSIKNLGKRFEVVKNGWTSNLKTVNQEGGSGFEKIKRILKYDLKAIDSEFDFILEDEKVTIYISYTNRLWLTDD